MGGLSWRLRRQKPYTRSGCNPALIIIVWLYNDLYYLLPELYGRYGLQTHSLNIANNPESLCPLTPSY